ncbi:MAG TPA: hypothetical protein VFC84_14955, partial [Desulfosporosinus sp.]|nr:hypothetical protein [Desulfosporosinus sp.]
MNAPEIQIKDVSMVYKVNNGEDIVALTDVNLDIQEGEYNAPMNPDKVFGILSEPDRIKDRKLSRKRVHTKWEEDNLQLISKQK